MTLQPRRVALTERDLALLRFVSENRIVLIEDLAARFFAFDPVTRRPNNNPRRACERRLKILADEEYLRLRFEHDGARRRRVATPGRELAGLTCARVERRRVAPRMRAHQCARSMRSMRSPYLRITGGRIVEQTDIRAAAQKGDRRVAVI